MKRKILMAMLLWLPAMWVYAQQTFTLSKGSAATVNGTSTLHDWTSDVTAMEGHAQVQDGTVRSLRVKFKTHGIKSAHHKMDKITWETLKAQQHPYIIYTQHSYKIVSETEVISYGTLFIAGAERQVEVRGKASQQGEKLLISGQHTLTFTDYGMQPPTALLGTIKVGNTLVIKFDLAWEADAD